MSCYELTKKWIGIADDLPDDLSVNQKYMEVEVALVSA